MNLNDKYVTGARIVLNNMVLPPGWDWESVASPYGVRRALCGDLRMTISICPDGKYRVSGDIGHGDQCVVYNQVPSMDLSRSIKEVCRVTLRRAAS